MAKVNLKNCIACASEIPKEAIICSVCKSDQRRVMRLIPLSSLMLSLLISFFAVLGIVWPLIKDLIVGKNSEIVVKQSLRENSWSKISNNFAIYDFRGSQVAQELKNNIRSFEEDEYSDNLYISTKDWEIYFDDEGTSFVDKHTSSRFVIHADSTYYFVIQELIVDVKLNYIVRNVGNEYGVIHYLKLKDRFLDNLKEQVDLKNLPSPRLSIASNDKRSILFDDIRNIMVPVDFIGPYEYSLIDTINRFDIYTKSLINKSIITEKEYSIKRLFKKAKISVEGIVYRFDDSEEIINQEFTIDLSWLENSESFAE